MAPSTNGYIPKPGLLKELMQQYPVFSNQIMPDYEILEMDPLLDSSNMAPSDWLALAHILQKQYEQFDGFVILHGTDTMAYSASALSFLLEGLRKPVILTGSQIPMIEPRNDAMENVVGALLFAANFDIPEVCIHFDNILIRGNRSVKIDCDGFRAFESPNLPPLGVGGIHMKLREHLVHRPFGEDTGLRIPNQLNSNVTVIWLFPGISAQIIRNALLPPLEGAVIQAFGTGNGPTSNKEFLEALSEATAKGIILIDCTQCHKGTVEFGDYETGSGMAQAGLVNGYDMTPEAALTKLCYLLGKDLPKEEIKKRLQNNLRGELSEVV